MRHLNVDQRSRRDLPVQVAVGIVLLAEQVGEDIVFLHPMPEQVHAVKVAGAADHVAQDGQAEDQRDQAAVGAAAHVAAAAIQPPFSEREQAHADQQQGPPADVPVPQVKRIQLVGFDQQRDHPDDDQHHRAEHGWTAEGAAVVALRPGRVALRIRRG